MRVLVYRKSFESFSQRIVVTLGEQTSEDDFVMYLIDFFEETTPFKAKIRHKITRLDFFVIGSLLIDLPNKNTLNSELERTAL